MKCRRCSGNPPKELLVTFISRLIGNMVLRTIDCLVIGAGPSGLTLGISLLRAGRTVLIVEKHDTHLPFSRAIVVNSKSLSELKGLVDIRQLFDRALPLNGLTVHLGNILSTSTFFDTNRPTPHHPISLPQATTENYLMEIFLSRGGQVLRGLAFDPVENDLNRHKGTLPLTIHLRGSSAPLTVECLWLFGCDGAHSAVRQALGLAFLGSTDRDQLYVMDAVVDAWTLPTQFYLEIQWSGARAAIQVLADPATVRVVSNTRTGCLSMLSRYFAVSSVVWDGAFTNSYRVAERFGRDNIWLVGDACQVHSPVGGRGMNTGIQEAIALVKAMDDGDIPGLYDAPRRQAAKEWVFWNYYLTQVMLGRSLFWCDVRAVVILVLAALVRLLGERLVKALFEKVAAVKVNLRNSNK